MRTCRLLVLVAGLGLLLGLGAAQVFAHADYESSTPGRDEVVQTAPAQVDVFFTQEILKQEGSYYVRVFNEQDEQVSTGDGTLDDDDRSYMFTELPSGLPDGQYIVQWKTLSFDDGDDDEGAFCFYVAAQPTAEQAAECAAFDEDEEPTVAGSVTPIGTTVAPTSQATEPSASPTIAVEPPSDDGDGTPVAAIIGAIIGGAVVLGIAAAAVFIWLRRTLA